MEKLRLHVVGLPHTQSNKRFCGCAYTGKVLRFCAMMKSLGYEMFHYGAEGSEVDCTRDLTVISEREQKEWFGAEKFDTWHERAYTASFDPEMPWWKTANRRAVEAIKANLQEKDFICLIAGLAQKPIADAIGESKAITVEYGIGYYGTFAKYRCFESYTHQACVYGTQSRSPDGSLYDCVIPNYFDPEDFPFCAEKQDYLLYLGRVIQRKGVMIAVETAKATGRKLIIAGPGVSREDGTAWYSDDGMVLPKAVCEYVGPVGVEKRAEVMGHARALLCPTLYVEPFGGVAVEAMLCGTPVISSDHGAFAETVVHSRSGFGGTGFRCHTLKQFTEAVERVGEIDCEQVHQRAVVKYSMWTVRYQFDRWFRMLYGLWGKGWPELGEGSVGL